MASPMPRQSICSSLGTGRAVRTRLVESDVAGNALNQDAKALWAPFADG